MPCDAMRCPLLLSAHQHTRASSALKGDGQKPPVFEKDHLLTLHPPQTKNLAELCTLVIDDIYGELPSVCPLSIFTVLLCLLVLMKKD